MDGLPDLLDLTSERFHRQRASIADYPAWAICRPSGDTGAALDPGALDSVSTPDFVTHGCGPTFAASAERCAAAILRNAAGQDVDGRGRPKRTYPTLEGYDLRYLLMPHWDRKILMAEMGLDPNVVLRGMRGDTLWSHWPITGDWIDRSRAVRHLEFFFHLCVAVEIQRARRSPQDVAARAAAVADALMIEISYGRLRVRRLDTTHAHVRLRAHRLLLDARETSADTAA